MRDKYQYGHDLHGALVSGYARRARTGARAAVKNSAGWMNPYSPNDMRRGDYAIRLVIRALLEAGINSEAIVERLEHEIEDMPHTVNDVQRSAKRTPRKAKEDPFDRWDDGYDWDQYDAYVDAMTASAVRDALKQEARIRAQAQGEIQGRL